jgi:hypothetical protein
MGQLRAKLNKFRTKEPFYKRHTTLGTVSNFSGTKLKKIKD